MDYVRVELWDPMENQENVFKARKFLVSVNIDSISGEKKIAISGNFNAVGDPVDGTFNTVDKTFTAVDSVSSDIGPAE